MSNSLLVGIDVSLNDNKVRILHPDGTSLSKFVVAN
ncbi:MAG: IS110 family transposase, partial [Syntrophomonadaceae bacterium]|nr:IS110 family transposase [Syntrophomonadaceae bacterium]